MKCFFLRRAAHEMCSEASVISTDDSHKCCYTLLWFVAYIYTILREMLNLSWKLIKIIVTSPHSTFGQPEYYLQIP